MVKHQRGARVYAFVCAAMFTTAAFNTLPSADGTSRGRDSQPRPAIARPDVPLEYYKLPNGLKVVLSHDMTTPTVVVAVYYNVGFRSEPRNRTGFAHLFEHMMFQGSTNLGKMDFVRLVESNGGLLSGSTHFDFTKYFQVVPAHVLEPILWAEADRMRGLVVDIDTLETQQDVVKNEIRGSLVNQPYGGFPWTDLPIAANTNWHNAHNFAGELEHLDAATLEDVREFFRTYFAPNNAVLVVTGDFVPNQARAWVEKYFATIPPAKLPAPPDVREPRQEQEKRTGRTAPLATRPALGLAYHVPDRLTPEWYAFGLLDQALAQGPDSLLYDALVRKAGITGQLQAGINWGRGNMFDYSGPMLWTAHLFHDTNVPADRIVTVIDQVIEPIRKNGLDERSIARAQLKMRSTLYSYLEEFAGAGRANLLASFALFDDDPTIVNRLEDGFAQVTAERLQQTAAEYLRPANRTVYVIEAGKSASSASREIR